MANYDVKIE